MTYKFLKALEKWQKEGKRVIKIEYDCIPILYEFSVWIYDYELFYGKHITNETELPTVSYMKSCLKIESEKKIEELKALIKKC